jgi:hypothetical protein
MRKVLDDWIVSSDDHGRVMESAEVVERESKIKPKKKKN